MYKDANYYTLVKRKRVGKPTYCYYCYTPDGKRVLRGTGAKTRAEALEIINKRIIEGKLIYPDGMMIRQNSTRKGTALFSDYFRDFYDKDRCPMLAEKKARGRAMSSQTITSKRAIVTVHLIPSFGSIRLCELKPYMIDEWLIRMANEGSYEKSSINQLLATLKNILDYAVRHGDLTVNPASSVIPLKINKSKRRAFSDEEIRLLFSHSWDNELVRIMCLLSAVTGMRLGEVRALRIDQIKDGYILVDASYSRDGIKCTKTGVSRMVPVPKRVEDLLLSIGSGDGFIFAGSSGKPISATCVSANLCMQLDKCGLSREGLCFHSFRHYANTKLVAADINAEKIRASIGHSSESMTEHYLHLEASDMKEIASVGDRLLDTIMS